MEDTIEVCQGCHSKMENIFKNLVLWGSIEVPKWLNESKARKRQKQWATTHIEKRRIASREWMRRKGKHCYIWFKFKDNKAIKKKITDLYWDKKLTLRQVAKKMGITQVTIQSWMRQLDIPTRSKSEAMKIALQKRAKSGPGYKYKDVDEQTLKKKITDLYWGKKLNLRKTAKEMSIAVITLKLWMRKLNITLRNKKETAKIAAQKRIEKWTTEKKPHTS